MIHFTAKLSKIGFWTIVRLPETASAKLPSRGMVLVEGTINNLPFQAVLEPDGKGSHWFKIDEKLPETVSVEIQPSKNWPDPEIPKDLQTALADDSKAHKLWMAITPMARWDWIRWIRATKDLGTRKRRIEIAFSKLKKGDKRPCCFNRTMCTVPEVSKNGVLTSPT
ncbi:MAG TPA: YdeI/OmpD-associated family protein [Alphaproteobacteria bacterium]|jgi:hypothetical protein|nr:YdeI/OmpD-associated family protein [Alphaproteobacteria bacterium]